MGKKDKYVQGLGLENPKERVHMLHISIYGNIRLTHFNGKVWSGLVWLRVGTCSGTLSI
jgi:hypothetical protein